MIQSIFYYVYHSSEFLRGKDYCNLLPILRCLFLFLHVQERWVTFFWEFLMREAVQRLGKCQFFLCFISWQNIMSLKRYQQSFFLNWTLFCSDKHKLETRRYSNNLTEINISDVRNKIDKHYKHHSISSFKTSCLFLSAAVTIQLGRSEKLCFQPTLKQRFPNNRSSMF